MAYAPSLTMLLDGNPGVQVDFPSLDPACAAITVQRNQGGRTFNVRGLTNKVTAGTATGIDYEVGLGTPATYRAVMFDAAGNSLGYTDASGVQLDVAGTYIHQPLNPRLWVKARVQVATSQSVQFVAPGTFTTPEGAAVGVWIGGKRTGIQNLQFQFRVASGDDGDTFLSMFGDYESDYPAVICVRTPPPVRLPRTLFLGPSNYGLYPGPIENAQANFTFVQYSMVSNEVQPPTPGLVVPLLSYADMNAAFATIGDFNAAYASYYAANSDYSKSGLGGGGSTPEPVFSNTFDGGSL